MFFKLVTNSITNVCLFIVVLLLSVTMANAQGNQASIKFNLFSVKGLVVSDIVLIDDKYAKKYGIPIKTPFKIKIPRQEGIKRYVEYGDKGTSMIIKVNFATGGDSDIPREERKLVENVQFISMSIPMDAPDRIKLLTSLMAKDAFRMATAAFEQKEFLGSRLIKVNGVDRVDAAGKYISPEHGLMYVRMSGYLNPNGANSIYSVANIVADKYELTNLDQLFLTSSGKTIGSFEYLSE